MKKIIKKVVLLLLLMNLGLTIQMAVVHAGDEEIDCTDAKHMFTPLCNIKRIGDPTGLPSFTIKQHPDAPAEYLQEGIGSITSPIYFGLDLFRYFISGIALLVVVIYAIKLIAHSTDEEAEKAKRGLIYGITGLLLINLADIIVKKMFFGEQGEAFEDTVTAELYAEESVSQVRGIIGFINAFVAAVAVLVIVIRGFVVLSSAGDEEALTKAKTHILYAIGGLVVVGLSELIVKGFIFPKEGTEMPNIEKGKEIFVMLTNYLSGFIALFAFLALFYAGYKYVISAGEEEANKKVKKIILGAFLALVIAMGAFAAVNTLVELKPQGDTAEQSLPDSN